MRRRSPHKSNTVPHRAATQRTVSAVNILSVRWRLKLQEIFCDEARLRAALHILPFLSTFTKPIPCFVPLETDNY